MQYVAFWEYDAKDEKTLINKFTARSEAGITRLYPPCLLGGQCKGFSVIEADDFAEIEKFIHQYTPELRVKIFPIFELQKAVPIRLK